jgi:hypothetical protein
LIELAKKHKATKFLKIKACEAIKGFPDKNCPCILVYHEGEMVKQWIGFGKGNVDSVEWALSLIGAVKTELTEAPKDTNLNKLGWKSKDNHDNKNLDSDEDDN